MVMKSVLTNKSLIWTPKELKVISKKLSNAKLTQQDSNYLSKYIRPKLKEINTIEPKELLDKLEYNQKAISIENRIKKTILKNIPEVVSIILYGSVVQNNYKNYNDIDIIVVTKEKIYKKEIEKWEKITRLKEILKKNGIESDIQIMSKKSLEYNSVRNPGLIYQLKDYKIIYGKIKLGKKIELYNADLHMKLDWSDVEDIEPNGNDIYKALRNTFLVRWLLNKIIDNTRLKKSLYEELGKKLILRLKSNQESKLDRKIAMTYLKELIEKTRNEIKGGLWERVKL